MNPAPAPAPPTSPHSDRPSNHPALALIAVIFCFIVGAISLVGVAISTDHGEWAEGGLCLIAAALAFGSVGHIAIARPR